MARRYAALTMARDEHFFLVLWHRYYATQFGAENCYVIDHNSQGLRPRDVLPELGNVFRLPFENLDKAAAETRFTFDRLRFWFVSKQIEALLEIYDVVIFNDCDEIFIVDPKVAANLPDYLDQLDEVGVRTGVGVEVMHDPATEADFDLELPMFAQRRYYRYLLQFSKPWIVSESCEISGHGVSVPFQLDPNLMLIHGRYLDVDACFARQGERQAVYKAGRVGPRARWKFPAKHVPKLLQHFSGIPAEDLGLFHQQLFEDWWPGYCEKRFDGINFPEKERKFGDNYSLVNYVKEDQMKALRNRRFKLPAYFEQCGI